MKIGIIGGSGLYQMPELTDAEETEVDTPFGKAFGRVYSRNARTASASRFLPRHGRGHKLTPTELPFRANIYAMKLLGVDYILSVSAVGSLAGSNTRRRIMVIPDQFFDRTRARAGRIDVFRQRHRRAHHVFASGLRRTRRYFGSSRAKRLKI